MVIRNRFKVTKKMWTKWSKQQRLIFNETFACVCNNQRIFNAHPSTTQLNRDAWRTVCWNIAFVAAQCQVDD